MAEVLQDSKIKALRGTGERQEIADSRTGGLRLRVSATGERAWLLWYRRADRKARRFRIGAYRTPDGRARKEGQGYTLAEARAEADALKRQIGEGRDPQEERETARTSKKRAHIERDEAKAHTVGSVCSEYLATRGEDIRPTTEREWKRLAVRIGDHFGKLPVRDLGRDDIRHWLKGLRTATHPTRKDAKGNATKVKGYSANRSLEFLRLALAWAITEKLTEVNPAAGIKKPTRRHKGNNDILANEKKRERALDRAEVRAVLLALDQIEKEAHRPGEGSATADALRLALLTGKRRRAVLGLHRDELTNLGGAEPLWSLDDAREKNDTKHEVPLSAPALAIIRRRLGVCDKRKADALKEAAKAGGEPHPTIGTFLWATHRDSKANAEPWWSRPEHAQQWLPQKFIKKLKERTEKIHGPMKPWVPHSLRSTFATLLDDELNVDPRIVTLLLNQTLDDRSVALGYNLAKKKPQMRAALVAWAAWLDQIKAEPANQEGGESRAKVVPLTTRALA